MAKVSPSTGSRRRSAADSSNLPSMAHPGSNTHDNAAWSQAKHPDTDQTRDSRHETAAWEGLRLYHPVRPVMGAVLRLPRRPVGEMRPDEVRGQRGPPGSQKPEDEATPRAASLGSRASNLGSLLCPYGLRTTEKPSRRTIPVREFEPGRRPPTRTGASDVGVVGERYRRERHIFVETVGERMERWPPPEIVACGDGRQIIWVMWFRGRQ